MLDAIAGMIGKGVAGLIDHGIEAAENLQLDSAALLEKVQLVLAAESARVTTNLASRRAARAAADAKIAAAAP